jgi:hypothetical protein
MLIRISEPKLVGDRCENFRRSEFHAESAGGSMLEVHRLDAPSPAQERREIELHLLIWRATNPGAAVDLVG